MYFDPSNNCYLCKPETNKLFSLLSKISVTESLNLSAKI